MIRVLLVDDHAALREPLAFMVEREQDMTVVAEAGSLAEARRAISKSSGDIDVAVVDLKLPDGSGMDLVGELREANPDAITLILSAENQQEHLPRAVEAGAAGMLHKSVRIQEIIKAVRRLHAGGQLIPPHELVNMLRLASEQRERDDKTRAVIEKLTRREKEVLQALAYGLNDREIAERLHVSDRTVRTHMVNILAKLKLDSRLQALVFAVRHGLAKIH